MKKLRFWLFVGMGVLCGMAFTLLAYAGSKVLGLFLAWLGIGGN